MNINFFPFLHARRGDRGASASMTRACNARNSSGLMDIAHVKIINSGYAAKSREEVGGGGGGGGGGRDVIRNSGRIDRERKIQNRRDIALLKRIAGCSRFSN